MRPTVQIGFDLALAGFGDFFTIGDPNKGTWGTASEPLAGDILTDVSDDVRAVDIRRGRSQETSNVDASSGTITLDNRLRLYDPLASSSVTPYAPSILPRKEVTVDVGGVRQFTGIVEDWDLEYSLNGDSITKVRLTDGLTLINERTLPAGAGDTGASGTVIRLAATDVTWPLARFNLDDGTASVGVHTIDDDQNALQYMQRIANTEQGLLFVDRTGALAFRDRISPRRTFGTIFADDGSGIPFTNIQITFGTEFLYTDVQIVHLVGTAGTATGTATFSDSDAADLYGSRELSLDTLLPGSAAAEPIGDLLIERYSDPTLRVTGIDVEIDALTQSQKNQILNLELGDGVRVVFTPNGIGEPIERELAVQSVEHSITPDSHVVRVSLFDPVLLRRTGSVSGSSSNTGSVTGVVGFFGVVDNASTNTGDVTGAKGAQGTVTGSSGTSGSVTGTVLDSFILNTSELDGPDRLGS